MHVSTRFDDGHASNINAFDFLSDRGIVPTAFVVAEWSSRRSDAISPGMIRELAGRCDFGRHGASAGARAARTFQMSVNLSLYFILPVIAAAVLTIPFVPLASFLRLSQLTDQQALSIIACTAAKIWMQTLCGLMAASLYATGSYGQHSSCQARHG